MWGIHLTGVPSSEACPGRSYLGELSPRPAPMTFSYRSCSAYVNSPDGGYRVSATAGLLPSVTKRRDPGLRSQVSHGPIPPDRSRHGECHEHVWWQVELSSGSACGGECGVRGGAGDFQGAGGLGDRGAVGDEAAERGDLGRAGHFRAADVLPAGQHPAFGLAAPGGSDAFGPWRSARSSSSYSAAATRTANMNRPSLVSRSKFSVSDFTLTARW